MNRRKKLVWNTISSVALQCVTVICGFILPRYILVAYGSAVNGLVSSVSQFLGVITLMDMGVGAVVQSSLYRPLAEKDFGAVSRIYKSGLKFFRRIALIFLVYIIVLIFLYPNLVDNSFEPAYSVLLIAVLSISSFAQYYFGIVNGILLQADQRAYVQSFVQIATLVINVVVSVLLIRFGFGIHVVKFTSSLVFLMRPLFLQWYVDRNYKLDRNIIYQGEPIRQKWNGMAQHFAYYVLDSTDVIVLTLFSSIANVSVYSVYNMVAGGIKSLVLSLTSGFQALLGNMLAEGETKKLQTFFFYVEWGIHTVSTICFGCTGILLTDFVVVYTKSVMDVNYAQPMFAVVLTAAFALQCIRLPYNMLILAAGHYRQTQGNYIIAMAMNIVISVAVVWKWGLIGVACGTLAAMAYQVVWMAWYVSKYIILWPMKNFGGHIAVDALTVVISTALTFWIPMHEETYLGFFALAFKVLCIWLFVAVVVNCIFYRQYVRMVFENIGKKVRNKFLKK